jgi:cellulose synthase/poly-beta-1,6-N-acetylglucosamine synthase-like glycosyltransferase
VNWTLLTHWWSLPQLVLDLLLLLVFTLEPLRRDFGDDQGDGKALVLLPTPHKVPAWRTFSFLGVFVVLDLIHEGLRAGDTIDDYYARIVGDIASTVINAPTQLQSSLLNFSLGVRFLVVATILALAATSIGPPSARLRLVGLAVLYVAIMMVLDSIITVLGALDPFFGSPRTLASQLLALFVGTAVLLRMLFTCYALPKPTAHPLPAVFAGRRRRNAIVMIAVTFAAIAVVTPPAVYLFQHSSPGLRPIVLAALPLPFAGLTSLARTAFLHMIRWTRASDPPPGSLTPPVEVIIPAYNEEACIVATLEAIEMAAQRYPGSVRVVLANDGSTDRTSELAQATARRMTYAVLEVIDVRHGGKSATLNAALAECTGGVVIRIDADTLIGADSILYATRWFADPEIGIVESLPFPIRGRSVFRKMRLFETLRIFGFMHAALQVVDGVNVVPGMFTAFRREAVVAIGGFTVGMNGEDADLTLTLGRIGWRSWLDPNVVIGEDVPPTLQEFRSQRVRWNRAGVHAFARHSPFRSGPADPRVWFSQVNQLLWKVAKPYHLTGVIYVVLLGAFQGWSQPVVEAAIAGLVVFFVSSAAITLLLGIRFRSVRRLGWFLGWIPYVVLKEFFVLESLLSLPARPVTAFAWGRGRAPVLITAPVVH